MSDKLDFTGFEAERPVPPPPRTTKPKPSTAARKTRKSNGRRKRRVNVSIEPRLSEAAVTQAEHRGMTLSDLVREAYREHHHRIDGSWFETKPEPFSASSPSATGRIVHMLYLTPEEVEILDDLAAGNASTRSGVVAVLLSK